MTSRQGSSEGSLALLILLETSRKDLFKILRKNWQCAMFQVSRDGGVVPLGPEGRGGSDVVEGGRTALDNKTSLLNTQPPRAFPGPRAREYNPYPYSDTINTYDKTALKEAVFDDDMDQLRDGVSSFDCLLSRRTSSWLSSYHTYSEPSKNLISGYRSFTARSLGTCH